MTNGKLLNTADTNYREIQDSQPGFGFAKDFGMIGPGNNGTALFSVGHYRDPAL